MEVYLSNEKLRKVVSLDGLIDVKRYIFFFIFLLFLRILLSSSFRRLVRLNWIFVKFCSFVIWLDVRFCICFIFYREREYVISGNEKRDFKDYKIIK